MKYIDAIKAKNILEKIDPIQNFLHVLNRKMTIGCNPKITIEISNGYLKEENILKIELNQRITGILKSELEKEIEILNKEILDIGNEDASNDTI